MTRVTTLEEARELLRKHGVVTLTAAPGVPSIVEAVAGERVRGSWWAHASGKTIFKVTSELGEQADVLTLKLVGGKVTFVARRLWAALARIATDTERIARMTGALDADGKRLLRELAQVGTLRLDAHAAAWEGDTKRLAKAREAIERGVLAIVSQVHTERGAHATVLTSWACWMPADVERAAHELPIDEARRALREACGGRYPFAGTGARGRRR